MPHGRRNEGAEGGIVIPDRDNEEAPGPSNPPRIGDAGQGCSRDDGGMQDGGNDDDDDGDYTRFNRLLGM